MSKVLITTVPFGQRNQLPLEMLHASGIEFTINPLNKKLTAKELASMIGEYDAVIAGTEQINRDVLDQAPHLKHISRVGVGLDSVDLLAAREKGIAVSYTPDAPAPAVAELTMGLMLSLLRSIHIANADLHQGSWNRHFGRRIAEVTIGIIGLGRIGTRVLRRIRAFGTPRVLAHDILPDLQVNREFKLEWCTAREVFEQCDLISFHVPLTQYTRNMVDEEELRLMKEDAMIVNTSRGGIVNETALARALTGGWIGGAAIDVFEKEPYNGPLTNVPNCLLTCHMGSMSVDCRSRMEIEATEEAIRFLKGKDLQGVVPEDEYALQAALRA
ncbi:MAG: phosphoglycerate dehydrogenase [Planctomycetota bacterium]|nr:phosphoglycerate dehydrogenase [Planctomycetota bacterium]